MTQVTKLTSLHTDLNADAVEWCPIPGLQHLLVCATYELIEDEDPGGITDVESVMGGNEQTRRGYLILYELLDDKTLRKLTSTESPGILDCKWSRQRISGHVCLGSVDAAGVLRLFKLDETIHALEELSVLTLTTEPSVLMLSLDWSNVLTPSEECEIAVSDSSGAVHLVAVSSSALTVKSSRKAHEFEAWIVAFDYFDTNVLFSGGDDCKLRIYDLRVDPDNPIRTSSEHTAGVTSVQSNWMRQYSVVSGSYDERVLFWDVRQMKRPQSEVFATGGVWRIKHDPFDCCLIACPCMYGGSVVLDSSLPEPAVVATYDFHDSINYGIDWCWKEDDPTCARDTKLIAVCSFYDKLLSLASVTGNTKGVWEHFLPGHNVNCCHDMLIRRKMQPHYGKTRTLQVCLICQGTVKKQNFS